MSHRPTIAYQPALDGVRAFAVIAVLLFHAGVPGFDGGYLGVSVFFTLSGFLITTLLLREHGDTGRIDLARFYARRLRRLLPASVLCLLGVALLGMFTDLFDGVADLRAHVLGAVFQVANWVFLAGEGSYQDLLARTSGTSSPLEHFWSLAIEEQFYWVWPPLMLLVLARLPHPRGRVVAVGALTAAACLAAPVVAVVWGADAAYWSTPARIGEILLGAFLAVVLASRPVPERARSLVAPALVVLGVCIVTFPSAGGPAYAGALPLVALASTALILGLQHPGPNRVRRAFEVAPAVWIGRISYGLYLFHWPVFVLVHPDRIDWPAPALFVVRLAITFAITVLSYELIEQPIRTQRRTAPKLTFVTAGLATGAVVVAAVTVVPAGIGEYWNPDADTAEAAAIDPSDEPLSALLDGAAPAPTAPPGVALAPPPVSDPTVPPDRATDEPGTGEPVATVPAEPVEADPPVTDPPEADPPDVVLAAADLPALPALTRPVRIVVTGDSTAKAFGTGLVNWAADNPDLAQVEIVSAPGCGFLAGGERRTGDTIAPIEGCEGWAETFLYPAVEELRPDVVVAMVTSWDLVDRRWDQGELITPLDPEFAGRLHDDYERLVTDLLALGAANVAFLRHPIPDVYWLPAVDAQEDPARHAVVYDLYDELAAADPRVSVVPLDRWMIQEGLDRSEEVRPDGIHPTPEAATEISAQFLGDRLVRLAVVGAGSS